MCTFTFIKIFIITIVMLCNIRVFVYIFFSDMTIVLSENTWFFICVLKKIKINVFYEHFEESAIIPLRMLHKTHARWLCSFAIRMHSEVSQFVLIIHSTFNKYIFRSKLIPERKHKTQKLHENSSRHKRPSHPKKIQFATHGGKFAWFTSNSCKSLHWIIETKYGQPEPNPTAHPSADLSLVDLAFFPRFVFPHNLVWASSADFWNLCPYQFSHAGLIAESHSSG